MHKLYNFIFIDIDGCFNKQFSKEKDYLQSDRFGFCQELVDNLKTVLNAVDNCKIVISSSWRKFRTDGFVSESKNWRDVLCDMLQVPYDTIYGDIPTFNEFTVGGAAARVADIKCFLEEHKTEVKNYVVIDDECSAIKKAFPNNYVDCDSTCFTETKAKEAIWILTNFGKDKKMNENVWFTSDTHFNHANIIKYCNRPFASVEEMNEKLIENWNSVVRKDDLTWCLGDFCLGPDQKKHIPELVSKLNGRINLVLGNHDHNSVKFYYDAGFNRVYDRKVIINDFVILTHAPLMFLNDNTSFFQVFGHVHDSELYPTFAKTGCCVCVERHDYKPISWKKIQAEYDKLNGKVE